MLRDRKHTIDLPTAAIFDIDGALVFFESVEELRKNLGMTVLRN